MRHLLRHYLRHLLRHCMTIVPSKCHFYLKISIYKIRRIAIGQHILKSPYQKPINARQNANVHNNIILQCGLLSLFFLFFMLCTSASVITNALFRIHRPLTIYICQEFEFHRIDTPHV